MNALQRIELLTEHANLVQSIPTLTGLSKIDSLERLGEIVVLLGGKVQDEVQNDIVNHRGKTDIDTLLEVATSRGGGNRSFANLAKVTDETAKKIKDILGVDVAGFDIGIDESAIRHTLNQHGNEQTEQKRGQTAVTEQDFALVAEITNNADVIKKGNSENTLQFEKQIGSLYVVVQELRIGKGKLSLKTMYKKGLTSVLVAPDKNQSTAETPETVGSLALENNIPQNDNDVNGGTLSQAFYDEFMLKNEMGELVFADDEFVDDVDIETHEKALVDGKTYAFGRALIAIDEVVLSRPMWSVVFGDFNHTLMGVSLFDSIANVDDFSVVAQVGVNLNNPKYKQYVLRLAVSDEGNIIAYPNETGDTALRHTIHYSEKDNVRALVNTAIQSIENERKQKDLLAQKQAKEAQLNTVNLSKKEIEKAFTGLSGVEISRAKNQLLKTLTTREFGEQAYKTFIETLIDDKGYQPRIANMMKQKGENAGDTKTVYRVADDDGRGYEINKTQYVYAKWYYEQKQYQNKPVPQDDESQKPEHSPGNEDGVGALSQNEQENTMNEPQNTEQPQAKETTGQAVAQILVNEYGWQYTNNQRTHIALGRYTNDKFGEFVVSADVKDDDIVANQPLTNVFIGGVRDVVQDAKDFHRRALDWLDGYQSKAVGKNAPEPNQNAEPTQEDKPMNEPQNPNYTQSDIDYLQSIINGTLDLETVDMDRMIEIGEKDEHDPMYEQALQIVSDYLDKLTSV